MAVDQRSRAVWIAAEIRKDLVRLDQGSGTVRTYQLATYYTSDYPCPVPVEGYPDPCGRRTEVAPIVEGLAVAPNGDLYFSDSTFNRIGVIHAGQ